MELKVKKFNDLITQNCKIIKDSHLDLSSLLKDYDFKSHDRALIDRNLVRMSVASQKVIDLILPIPSAGEIAGLPKEATQLGDEIDVLIVDKENPNWDFRPWFAEKAGRLKKAINKVINYLETDPQDLELHPSYPKTPEQFLAVLINLNMAEVKEKAETILSMVESGRLTVTDVKLDEEE